jgi:hypothetical protein
MAAAVVRDNAKTILGEEKQLVIPGVGIQRPAVPKRNDRPLAPVFVINFLCRLLP